MLLRTNSKEYRKNIEAYIFDCIDNKDEALLSMQEKIVYAMSEFNRASNYPHNLNRFPNHTDRLADYLQGLPFDFAFSGYDVLKYSSRLHNLGSIPANKEDIIINNWFKHIAANIIRLADKYDIRH